MGFVSSIVGGILGAGAAGNAASTEANAAKQAQNLELQNQQNAQNFQTGVWSGTQGNEQPFLGAGQQSVNNLANLVNNPNTFKYGQQFQAPTLAQAEQTPGYQFNLQQGTDAITKQAAATGNLLSGTTGTALEQYGQGLAENAYQQDYQNALNTYMTNYGVWNQGLQEQLGGLQGVTNTGLSSAATTGALGQQAANTMANVDLTGGYQQAQQINNAAAARAQGILGQAGAYSNMAGGIAGGFGNMDFSGGSSPLEMLGQFAGL